MSPPPAAKAVPILTLLVLFVAASAAGCSALERDLRACDGGRAIACTRAADVIAAGPESDPARALKLNERGCELTNEIGCRAAAQAYACGEAVTRNLSKSLGFRERACLMGDRSSCLRFVRESPLDPLISAARVEGAFSLVCGDALVAGCTDAIPLLVLSGATGPRVDRWLPLLDDVCRKGDSQACLVRAMAGVRADTLEGDDAVRALFTARNASLRACVAAEATCGVQVQGRGEVRIVVGPGGGGSDARVSAASWPQRARTCVEQRIASWTFPVRLEGHEIVVPLVLSGP